MRRGAEAGRATERNRRTAGGAGAARASAQRGVAQPAPAACRRLPCDERPRPGGRMAVVRGRLREITMRAEACCRCSVDSSEARTADPARVPTRFSRAGHTRRRRGSLLHRPGVRPAAGVRGAHEIAPAPRSCTAPPMDRRRRPRLPTSGDAAARSIQSAPLLPCHRRCGWATGRPRRRSSGGAGPVPEACPKAQHFLQQRRLTAATASIYAGFR